MTERAIPLGDDDLGAVLCGRKTEMRIPVGTQPGAPRTCPLGDAGDRLWVGSAPGRGVEVVITAVSVERLQAITLGGMVREGLRLTGLDTAEAARAAWAQKWNRTHGDEAPWAASPAVWVVRFKRVNPLRKEEPPCASWTTGIRWRPAAAAMSSAPPEAGLH